MVAFAATTLRGRGSARRASGRSRAQGQPGSQGRRERAEKTLFGVPERFMGPRLVMVATVGILTAFGLLMVYSSSSVSALESTGNAAYYLIRQAALGGVGVIVAAVLAFKMDYHLWTGPWHNVLWLLTVVLLVLVFTPFAGGDAYGANRWIVLPGGMQLQPSEFAKIMIIITAASICQRYFEDGSLDWNGFVKLMALGVGIPLVLIVAQPDKGSTMILGITIVTMGYLAGVPKRILLSFLVLGVAAFLALSLKDDYSRQRFLTMFDPWSDPYNNGYQLIQGFYAFGSGGLTGVGIGYSTQKYSYLPMAHNDFIFAVIGEECGLVGTVGMLVGFAVFAWAGFRIAKYAPDLAGRLIAAGCTTLVVVQMLLNVAGVLGIFPLSGKPIPFISYGGTSILANLMLVGVVLSVSLHSHLPETAYDSARRSWRMAGGADGDGVGPAAGRGGAGDGFSFVGEVRPRSARGEAAAAAPAGRPTFTVMDGGRATTGREARGGSGGSGRAGRGGRVPRRGRTTTDASGRQRIDLGPTATERLRRRSDGGPRSRR